MSQKPLVIAVTGPTAAGKTDLAMQLCKHFPIELINMDSAQVYRDMDIGTAKLSTALQQQYPHHLMSIISPEESYSAAQFVEDVHGLVPQIIRRGAMPLLVGGTILYYRALTQGLAELPPANHDLRAQLRDIIDKQGHQALQRELRQIDPTLAASIQGKDTQRLIRFVEIARLTKKPPSQLFAQQDKNASPYRFFHIAFVPEDRTRLHNNIAQRFDQMLEKGLVDEVKGLLARYCLDAMMPSMRCAGYRQVWQYLHGAFDDLPKTKNNKPRNTAMTEMRDRGIFATRQLAKRQLTWLRKTPADVVVKNVDRDIKKTIIDALRNKEG